MRWDLFCKVIDNHGDLGVCWRLAAQLAARGETVRLWVDDGAALQWMAPAGSENVEVIDWAQPAAVAAALHAPAPDVLVEAFGCDPDTGLIAQFAREARTGDAPRVWLNLEYLSAEPYVERLHTLPSPVFKGPGEGLTKYFFYPGFTTATGGLLREPDLRQQQADFDRAAWLAVQGVDRHPDELLVLLFCYEPMALAGLLAQWTDGASRVRLLVTAGRASAAVHAALGTTAGTPCTERGMLSVQHLPLLAQRDFDRLLWSCDLNFVRGEDSLVRALWAGRPFVWQIYAQDDDAHHVKLNAWLDAIDAPASLRRFHHAWNGIDNMSVEPPGPDVLASWSAAVQAAQGALHNQDDLVTQLLQFVQERRVLHRN
ncbi:elongation factor P maturation arginine rhamnosyltransferase EarP [Variovorax ginsengisoli]|uniref:Protein-arginine rhamnosyltransferase n=1 Tax=Variovorax ginsengisoli TaxID=363844 RepID=A0ABT9S6D3_9BURK|nr:elongation factor P maturation arginine rhamnosyltransferase EarP [Variovorax ginsengisoli]MDP9899920.1 putative repeat protein (TIGR03837 family) [Variovorax ginsengisoli]